VLLRQKDRGWSFHAAWIVLIFITALAATDAVLAPTPAPKQPDFIDTILASRAVVAAIRIAIVFAGIFVVLSVTALIARRQWLRRVGPVEVEEVSDLDTENQQLRRELDEARQIIKDLRQKVAISEQPPDEGKGQ
jgi:hypothetical protein